MFIDNFFFLYHKIRRIHMLFKRHMTNTAYCINKAFSFQPLPQINLKQTIDHFGHLVKCKGWTDNLADRTQVTFSTAKRYLIPLIVIFLFHPGNADIADMMLPTGIDATRDVQ